MTLRIGIDLGGTKTEIVALDAAGAVRLRRRAPTPPSYDGVIALVGRLVETAEAELGSRGTVGLGIPGSLSPATGLVRGANSTWLNGGRLDRDLAARLGREVRLSNDANCLGVSEAADGAGAGFDTVFAVILGTGVGAGIVTGGRILEGRNRVAGEWGHNPLPWMRPEEYPGPACWCGKQGCIETFLCGPALAADADGPGARDASALPARAAAGDAAAAAALARHADRLARALAHVVNILDPDCILLGGGLSNMAHLYEEVPKLLGRYVFSDVVTTPLLRARHGDSSGVLGAARLWD
ncbi:ROK family protein [Siccirubricoccus sp. KC 17139]|uniref:ROK family protein n=1 Tax=Siccirubricoccus soli TaxID=2899147 RepID=A0ABT1CZ94_9PROT|nr:ROK family protein [Siccirubricoccus soli]MCO6414967.1 ROK family protein [Siccirubricoccus soli]MCP2681098.1 ROK family protein [Siccirubricoccus soli]